MTAQGGDILAWLKAAVASREQIAFDALKYERGAEWAANGCTVEVVGGLGPDGDVFEETVVFNEGSPTEEQAKHIAANDPAAVLRRCAADRKLIADHGPCSAKDWSCKGCGFDNREEPMVGDYRDCPVLNALAEGYGWTEGER